VKAVFSSFVLYNDHKQDVESIIAVSRDEFMIFCFHT